ncbi:MAG: hypothetical protein Q8S33_20925 [Myxococcales bacterium]|nr:hypothetical protein [Myxococcales bacterium]
MRFKGGNLPTLMERAGRVFFLVVCLTASVVFSATPAPMLLSGPYQVGGLGLFTLKVTRSEVKGVYLSGSRCDFKVDEPLLEGSLEGSVFVGKLTTCFTGSGCGSTGVIPFLGVVSDTSITGYLTIPAACSAPGLENRLTIQLDFAWLKKLADEAWRARKWDAALPLLRRMVQLPSASSDPKVFNQLGVVYNQSKAFAEGRQVFEAALELANRNGAPAELKSDILYNLACAEAGVANRDPVIQARAIEHLRQAIQLSPSALLREGLANDADLDPLRGLPEFQKLAGTRKGPR